MITEEEIIKDKEKEEVLGQLYLKGIMDFIKWTSTVAIAAILWIGNDITSMARPSRIIALAALAFLVFSLITAILTIRQVLTAWATKWVEATEDYDFDVMKKIKAIEPSKVTEDKEHEQINRLIKAHVATKPFSEPKRFSRWVSCHMILLLEGLVLYIVAQVFSTL